MSDLNDLSRPVTTDTEPNVLDTLRGHVARAATWAWGATANKVAGLMSATTAAVSGGRSLRLYRRNDANTADEEVVSLPGVSIGGNATTASAAQSGSALESAIGSKAPLNSPNLTGIPTAPTAAAGTNTTQVASTAFVRQEVASIVGSSGAALDTLQELGAALGNDPNFASSVNSALANRVSKTSAARPGVDRVYRNDGDSDYSGQLTWQADKTGFWSFRGYAGDAYHAPVFVGYAGYADSAGSVSWGNVSGKPTTVAGFGITDMSGQSVSYAVSSGSAGVATRTGRGGGNVSTNVANGDLCLTSNTTGSANTAMGVECLKNNDSGFANSSYGYGSLYSNASGTHNSAFGVNALNSLTGGSGNSAFGSGAVLFGNVNFNSAFGHDALQGSTYNNCSGFGYQAAVTGSNQVQLGNSATTTYVYGTVQNRSDERDKADIRPTALGLDFIRALRPIDYRWDMREDYRPPAPTLPAALPDDATDAQRAGHEAAVQLHAKAMQEWGEACKLGNLKRDGSKKRSRFHHGFGAAELKATLDRLGVDFGGYQDHGLGGGDDVKSVGYDEFIAPLCRAVQQLADQVDELKSRLH